MRLINCAAVKDGARVGSLLRELHSTKGLMQETVKPHPAPDLFLSRAGAIVVFTCSTE